MSPTENRQEPFDPEAIVDPVGIGAALRAANFDFEHVNQRFDEAEVMLDPAFLRRRIRDDPSPFALASRLFLLAAPVSEAALAELFSQGVIDQLTGARLLYRAEDGWRARARLTPLREGDLWIANDYPRANGKLAPDYVLNHGPASKTLQFLTPRRSVGRALDMGCGAGSQTLLAARHCTSVVGIDISERALNFSRLNARLNGLDNVEFRHGSFFEPVAGEKFELIVCNPPYVIAPDTEYVYRTGNTQGDGVSEHVVRSLGGFLEEGGIAVTLMNWHHPTGTEWEERPLSWTAGNACDNLLIQTGYSDPLSYAKSWLGSERASLEDRDALFDEWLAYYRRLGIERICAGAVAMRRRSAAENWTRTDVVPNISRAGSGGAHLERILAAETFFQTEDDAATLAARFQMHPDHVVRAEIRFKEGQWAHRTMKLMPSPGLDYSSELDPVGMTLIGGMDGTRTLREVIERSAAKHGLPPERAVQDGLARVRHLFRAGFLILPGQEKTSASS